MKLRSVLHGLRAMAAAAAAFTVIAACGVAATGVALAQPAQDPDWVASQPLEPLVTPPAEPTPSEAQPAPEANPQPGREEAGWTPLDDLITEAERLNRDPPPAAAATPAAGEAVAEPPRELVVEVPLPAAPDAPAPDPAATEAGSATLASARVSNALTVRPVEYRLGAGDRLRVIVFSEEALSGEFVIDSTGRVALPLIGEVNAEALTVRQFEERVQESLRDGYLIDPRVSVEVLNFRPFYILGEVQQPGEYPYSSGLTVLNAVATAGGFSLLANRTRVFIKPAGAEEERELPLGSGTLVAPGDTIRIAKGAFYILGEVNQPGEYPFSDGLTVMNAVATAQGFTYRANQQRVIIQREGEADERSYRLTPDLRVQPGDTLRIVERFF